MKLAILGAGALGSSLARALTRQGLKVGIAGSREPSALGPLIEELGSSAQAITSAEALKADIVVLAVRWQQLESVLQTAPAWNGRIVIDASNPVAFLEPGSPEASDPSNPLAAYGIKAIDLQGRLSSDVVRDWVPGARLVKAFNHLEAAALATTVPSGPRVLFYSGDEASSKAEVRGLIEVIGHFPVDLGPLATGATLASLPFGALASNQFVKV